jgi:tetratricopeptide (TPR) repeat protein
MKRTGLLAVVLALYVAVLGRGPAGRAIGNAGFDALDPRPSAVEQLIVAGRFAEALPLALELRNQYPNEPLTFYWLAMINHHLTRWHEEAEAWTEYVRTSAAPREACPDWPAAYARNGEAARALSAAARCEDMARQ